MRVKERKVGKKSEEVMKSAYLGENKGKFCVFCPNFRENRKNDNKERSVQLNIFSWKVRQLNNRWKPACSKFLIFTSIYSTSNRSKVFNEFLYFTRSYFKGAILCIVVYHGTREISLIIPQ